MLFTGFRKCLQDACKYRRDTERVFSVILEDDKDVLKWFRPGRRDIRIFYRSGTIDQHYEPDFIVETNPGKWICETRKPRRRTIPKFKPKPKLPPSGASAPPKLRAKTGPTC